MGAPEAATDKDAKPRELTGEERALYDRQIRLWGAEAQRRLSAGRVLVVGDVRDALLQELAKNVVLAGIKMITFACDEKEATNGVASCPGFLGHNAAMLREALMGMNPLVTVTSAKRFEAVAMAKSYDVVCSSGGALDADLALADACDEAGVPFIAGRMAGFVGWLVLGLGKGFKHTPDAGGADVTDDLPTLRTCLAAQWGDERKRSAFGWHMVCTLLHFEREHKRLPGNDPDDVAKVEAVYKRLAEERSPTMIAPDELVLGLASCAHLSIPALAAIVGGVWGREVVKVLSRKDEPLKNLFFYNARLSRGYVELCK